MRLFDAGVVAPVLAAMAAHGGSAEIVVAGLRMLWNLSVSGTLCCAARVHGCVEQGAYFGAQWLCSSDLTKGTSFSVCVCVFVCVCVRVRVCGLFVRVALRDTSARMR